MKLAFWSHSLHQMIGCAPTIITKYSGTTVVGGQGGGSFLDWIDEKFAAIILSLSLISGNYENLKAVFIS